MKNVTQKKWVQNLTLAVMTQRPSLPLVQRSRQIEALENFRKRFFEQMPHWDGSWKRGRLFELLLVSDPRYPKMNSVELEVASYLIEALKFDLFGILGYQQSWSNPDALLVRISKGVAIVYLIIEVKMRPADDRNKAQLQNIPSGVRVIANRVDKALQMGLELPPNLETQQPWPKAVKRVRVAFYAAQILYVPARSMVPSYKGWTVIESPFTAREVMVIATFLWRGEFSQSVQSMVDSIGLTNLAQRAIMLPTKTVERRR